jgi:hypothetical protein
VQAEMALDSPSHYESPLEIRTRIMESICECMEHASEIDGYQGKLEQIIEAKMLSCCANRKSSCSRSTGGSRCGPRVR